MPKVLLLSSDEGFRRRHVQALVRHGFEPVALRPGWPACYDRVKHERPQAIALDFGADGNLARQTAIGLRESKATAALPLVLVRVDEQELEEVVAEIPRTLIVSEESLAEALWAALPARADRPHAAATRMDDEDDEIDADAEAVGGQLADRVPDGETPAERVARVARKAIADVAHQATEALQRASESIAHSTGVGAGVVRHGPAAEPPRRRRPAGDRVAKAAKVAAGMVLDAVLHARPRPAAEAEEGDEEPPAERTATKRKRAPVSATEEPGGRTRKTVARARQTLAVAAVVATESTRRTRRTAARAKEAAETTRLVARTVTRKLASDAEDRVRDLARGAARPKGAKRVTTAAAPDAGVATARTTAGRAARATTGTVARTAGAARATTRTVRKAAGTGARKAADRVRSTAVAADRLAASTAREKASAGRLQPAPAPRRAATAGKTRAGAAPGKPGTPKPGKSKGTARGSKKPKPRTRH